MNTLINKTRVKRFALDYASQYKKLGSGSPRFTRVSQQFLDDVEAAVRQRVVRTVESMPSCGRTL